MNPAHKPPNSQREWRAARTRNLGSFLHWRAALIVTSRAWHLPYTWEPVCTQPASPGNQFVCTKTKGSSWHPEQQEACDLPHLKRLEGRGEREERGRWGCRDCEVKGWVWKGRKGWGGKRNWSSFSRKPDESLRCLTPRSGEVPSFLF